MRIFVNFIPLHLCDVFNNFISQNDDWSFLFNTVYFLYMILRLFCQNYGFYEFMMF